ncbi:MAG: hypothetical protein H6685_03630 [Deltaproteobacteria bacterium]|nr:hypothetical protein [Deltaproteobacteria bacterium]
MPETTKPPPSSMLRRDAPIDRPRFWDLPHGDKALVLLFGLILYHTHLLLYLVRREGPYFVVLAGMIAVIVGRDFLPRWARLPRRVATAIYYLAALVLVTPVLGLVTMADPWIWALVLGYTPLFALMDRLDRRRSLMTHIGVCLLFYLYGFRHLTGACLSTTAPTMFVLAILVGVRRREKARAFFGTLPLAMFVLTMSVYVPAMVRYMGLFPEDVERITSQPGVRLIYSFTNDPPYRGAVGDRYMFAQKFGDGYLLGPHGGNTNIHLLTVDATGTEHIDTAELGVRGGDRLAFSPDDPNMAYMGAVGQVVKLSAEPFRLLERYPAEKISINNVRMNPEKRWLIGSYDMGTRVLRLTLDDGRITHSPPEDVGLGNVDVVLDNDADRFYGLGLDLGANTLIEGRQSDMQFVRQVRLPGPYAILLDIDPRDNRLYLPGHFTGEMRVIDAATLREIERVPLGAGTRDLLFDPARRLLYVMNYFTGELLAYDVDKKVIVNSVDLGKILKPANLSPDGKELTARSGSGIFAVDVETVFGPAAREKFAAPPTPPGFFARIYHAAVDFAERYTFLLLMESRG